MKKGKRLPRVTPEEIADGWAIVRGMVEAVEAEPLKNNRERLAALKQIKGLVGLLMRKPMLKGAQKGAKRSVEADAAVRADISKFGSLPKAIKAHLLDGKLSATIEYRSHYERIRKYKE